MSRPFACRLSLVAFALLTGCSRSPFHVAPVHGTVSIDDKRLFQGKVMFAPIAEQKDVNPGKPGWGEIQSDGSYRLTTFEANDGAIIGEHWVTIVNTDERLPDGVPKFARVIVPDKKTVAPGKDNEIDIKLSGATVKKYSDDDR